MFGFSSFSELPFSSQPTSQNQLEAEAGLFVLTGSAASFTLEKTIAASPGSYTITGGDATFIHNQVIYAGAFSFLLTGQNADLLQNKSIIAQPGAYALTGSAASFVRARKFNVSAGAFVYTGKDATFNYNPIIVEIISKGGLPKEKKKRKEEKESREQLEAIVKREFDILDGTYVPEAAEAAKETVLPQIKQLDLSQYEIAIAQVNALLLQAKIKAAEYEAELDDEEAILMLL